MKQILIATLLGMTVAGCAQSSHPRGTSERAAFSVRDSIEMTLFSDPFTRTPGATAKEAPDGSGFIIVTTRGHLATNELESCLWYFSSKQLDAYIHGGEAPRPRLLLRKAGVPEAEQFNSYGSLITDVEWSSDSRSLRLIVEGPHGVRHPYRVTLSGQGTDVAPSEKGDVADFTSRAGTIAYLTAPKKKTFQMNQNDVSTVVTGHGILDTLFPSEFPDPPGIGAAWKLRVLFRGHALTFPSDQNRYFPFIGSKVFAPSISPDGLSVVTLVPVDHVPESWSAYKSADHTLRFTPAAPPSDDIGRQIDWPWQYAVIDLVTRKTVPLADAPTAYTTAWGGPFEAKWSHAGGAVIITKTYLPVASTEQQDRDSVVPCAIAEYTVKTQKTACLAWTPPPEEGQTLLSADYDYNDAVVAEWVTRGKHSVRKYYRETRQWTAQEAPAAVAASLRISIRQDMDVSPTLWVTEGTTERLLWDPNPQLRTLKFGKASLYRWTDTSGYTWRGGLVLPRTPRPQNGYPLVIQTHGFYNEHEFLADGAFTPGSAAQPLACSGIAVLQMEDRVGRRARPSEGEADDEVNGIESAIDQLVAEHLVDASRTGVQGFSRTSWYVEKALEHSPGRYAAALLIDGVDQSYVQDVLFVPGYPLVRSDIESSIGAPPYGSGLKKWVNNAAGFNLDKITAPVRLEAHGSTFSVLGEWEIYSILQQQRKAVDFIDIPHGQHILQNPRERYVSQQGAVDWFRFWLQGYTRLDVEASADYARWENLRRASSRHSTTVR